MLRRYNIRGRKRPIPRVSTKTSQPQPIDYAKGWHKGNPNDLQPERTLREVFDMRFNGLGKYKTRQGCDRYSVPIGETVNAEVISTDGASDLAFSTTVRQAEKLTAIADGVLTKAEISLKNSDSATGTVIVEVYTDNSGVPGDKIASSSISSADITNSYSYVPCYFMQAPTITNTDDYWIVVYLQASGRGNMYISSTTDTTNSKMSDNNGELWTDNNCSFNTKLYTSTPGGVRGVIRVYRPDGTPKTFFAHGTDLYLVDDNTGVTTSVDSGLNAGSIPVRFEFVNDTLYYTDGNKPRKYDWSTSSQVTASPYIVFNLMEHVGILFFFDINDPTRLFYTKFADYESFTSTDFIYVPAPKKSDHLKAMAKLNGVLYLFTRANKHMLMGQDNATFRLDEAYAQKGTFSQESVVYDENFIYFASDDGVYKFNGTTEKNIAKEIMLEYGALLNKEDIHLQLHDNKLYVWYRPNGSAITHQCFVYNTLYDVWESNDLNTYIGRSFARHDTTDMFLQASNRCGAVYYGERESNDYNNLGDILYAETRTNYDHFGNPQQLKRIPYWRPILEKTTGNYTLQAGYDADYLESPTFEDVNLQGTGYLYDDPGSTYGDITYAVSNLGINTSLQIDGSAYRWQRRYKHHASREPIEFAGEVLNIQTRRLR